MRTSPDLRTPLISTRLLLLSAITLLLSGWSTCSVMGAFVSCQTSFATPQATSLAPNSIPLETKSVVLNVNGSNFILNSQIMWNGNSLPTTFINSGLLQTTITDEMLDSFGVDVGSTVEITVASPKSITMVGCVNGGSSASLMLAIE